MEKYQSIVGTNDYIIAGGTTETTGFNLPNQSKAAVITRIDVPSHVHRWSRTYHANNDDLRTSNVLGMALNNDKVAVSTSDDENGSMARGYIFIISAVDGGHLNMVATRVSHGDTNRRYKTSSSAMFFSDYDTVHIAWFLNMYPYSGYTPQGDDLSGSGYDGRIRVG